LVKRKFRGLAKWATEGRKTPETTLGLNEAVQQALKVKVGPDESIDDDQLAKGVKIFTNSAALGEYDQYVVDRPSKAMKIEIEGKPSKFLKPVDFVIQQRCNLVVRGKKIGRLSSNSAEATITVENCQQVHTVYLNPGSGVGTELTLKDSAVGNLELTIHCVTTLKIENTAILNLTCPTPQQDTPFLGSVTFRKPFFSPTTKGYPLEGAQPYRNLRFHLEALENKQAGDWAHAAELAVERETQGWVTKLLNRTYQLASNFGMSPGRPILWIIGLWAFGAVVLYYFDGALLRDDGTLEGWEEIFLAKGKCVRAKCAMAFSFESLANPFGVLPMTDFFVASNFWIRAWLAVQSVLSTTALTLFFLAVRRKFRMGG
jgi:hypothetical protein